MATHNTTSASRRQAKSYRERWLRSTYGAAGRTNAAHVTVPADVERLQEHAPCTFCGTARGGCKHRPWMLIERGIENG